MTDLSSQPRLEAMELIAWALIHRSVVMLPPEWDRLRSDSRVLGLARPGLTVYVLLDAYGLPIPEEGWVGVLKSLWSEATRGQR